MSPLSATCSAHTASRRASVAGSFSAVQFSSFVFKSTTISSPASMNAIGPPSAASGPTVPRSPAPPNRPRSARRSSTPRRYRARDSSAVMRESGPAFRACPAAPLGPRHRTMIHSPLLLQLCSLLRSSSSAGLLALEDHAMRRAELLWSSPPSTPASFRIAEKSGERLPPSTRRPPVGL